MERNNITRVAITASLFLASCNTARNNQVSEPIPLGTPSMVDATPTPAPHPTEVPASGKKNLMTGTVYPFAADPLKENRECLGVHAYPQTVDGGAVALGPNPRIYIDVQKGDIYSNGTLIGTFTPMALPDPLRFGHIYPADHIVVCDNSGK